MRMCEHCAWPLAVAPLTDSMLWVLPTDWVSGLLSRRPEKPATWRRFTTEYPLLTVI